ncbi:polysaccharide deacetylase family protein [Streptomyces sp. NPDC056821]|uniref:polysaccharide deacetylase family protein n=1 Tax=unclassified Streptomyces TaxID=2593676 RepID=UPI0036CC6F0F
MRDYRGYGENPPSVAWPGGARVAVSVVLNIEDGAERSVARGDTADDRFAHWEQHSVHPTERNLALESAFEYGARAGIWRILRALREFDVRGTAFCCALALKGNPSVAEALVRDGHEIANHGLAWDTHSDLSPQEEASKLRESTAIIERMTGQRPGCWYSRDGISPATLDMVTASDGYRYDSNSFADDLPYLVQTAHGPLPVVPYAGDTNDSGLLGVFPTGRAFAAYLCDSLDMLLADTRPGPSVLNVGLHPRLIGRPGYIGALRTFLAYSRSRPGTWFAGRRAIAEHWRGVVRAR